MKNKLSPQNKIVLNFLFLLILILKFSLLEDEVISKRRARNRSRILYFCKTIIFYIFLFYLFFIPNMILVFVYHEQFLLFFGNEKN